MPKLKFTVYKFANGSKFQKIFTDSQVRTAEIRFVHFFLKFYKNHDNQKLKSLLIFLKCFIVIYRPSRSRKLTDIMTTLMLDFYPKQLTFRL